MTTMKLMYAANILVAGWISIQSMFFPKTAAAVVFSNAYPSSEFIRLVGCLWFSIALISALGLWKPLTFSPIFLVQLIYKSIWLILVALPAILHSKAYPTGMAAFFIVWVLILPFIIPWKNWL